METLSLFAYGTLKSTQPEHIHHCRPPLSAGYATVRGTLWRLREGYPILQIDPKLTILDATDNLVADWQKALDIARDTTPPEVNEGKWIEGELFKYVLNPNSLEQMDRWENFTAGIKGTYQRRVIWIKDELGADVPAWAYTCYSPPNWAVQLSETSWDGEKK